MWAPLLSPQLGLAGCSPPSGVWAPCAGSHRRPALTSEACLMCPGVGVDAAGEAAPLAWSQWESVGVFSRRGGGRGLSLAKGLAGPP